MTKLTPEDLKFRNEIFKKMVERCDFQGLPKAKREAQAMEYFCGVTQTLHTLDHPLKDNFLMIAAMIFQARGAYSEAKRMIAQYEAEMAVPA